MKENSIGSEVCKFSISQRCMHALKRCDTSNTVTTHPSVTWISERDSTCASHCQKKAKVAKQ